MKYFVIENSLNERILGRIEQVKEVKHNCHIFDDLNFIDRFPFKKIEITPILSTPVLYSNSKLTDLITVGGIGFSSPSIVISDKLKVILDKFNCYGIQFFQTSVIHKNKKIASYWQTHIYDIPYNYIDFEKTLIYLKNSENRKINYEEPLNIINIDDFNNCINSLEYPFSIHFKDIFFTNEMDLDYFFLRYLDGGHRGIVSEKLKDELESRNCTGIEFRPIELTLQDWYQSGIREKTYGKH